MWIDTFATALQAGEASQELSGHPCFLPRRSFRNCTLRQSVRVTLRSKRIRLRFSNAFSDTPLSLTRVTVGQTVQLGTPDVRNIHNVLFSGEASVEIPPRATWVSDPLDFATSNGEDISVSMYLAEGKEGNIVAAHGMSKTTSFIALGDHASSHTLPVDTLSDVIRWYFIEAVEVDLDARALVCLGDSITDSGDRAWDTDAYNGWVNLLYRRLQANRGTQDMAVLNAGIAGDLFWEGALPRLDRDVLKPGVEWVMVLLGTNDIGSTPDLLEDQARLETRLITGFEQLIERAHGRGIKVMASTILPRVTIEEARLGQRVHRERTRQRVNEWILHESKLDYVVDWAAALAGEDQRIMREDYRFRDFVHPNQKGNRTMADLIDITIF